MTLLVLTLALLAGSDSATALEVREAEATVGLYEARLRTAKIQVKQDQIVRDYNLDRAWKLYRLQATGAVTLNSYLECKRDYEVSALEVEQSESEVEEAHKDLEVAKVRRELIASGGKSTRLKIDPPRTRKPR
jgi:hypothetical protein